MAIVLIEDIDRQFVEWVAVRKQGIGASEIGIVAGLNTYTSPLELWARKTGKTPDIEDNEFMAVGRALEPIVVQMFQKKTGFPTIRERKLYRHQEIEWAIASPDARCDGPFGEECVEIKTTTGRNAHRWSETEAPELYQAQLCWQQGVLGLKAGYLAGLIGGDPRSFFTPHFDFDPELFSMLLDDGRKFMDCIKRDIPPQAGPGDSALIEQVIERRKGVVKAFSEPADVARVHAMIAQLEDCRIEEKRLRDELKPFEAAKKEAENNLKLALGDASIGKLPGLSFEISSVFVPARYQNEYSYTKLKINRPKKGN